MFTRVILAVLAAACLQAQVAYTLSSQKINSLTYNGNQLVQVDTYGTFRSAEWTPDPGTACTLTSGDPSGVSASVDGTVISWAGTLPGGDAPVNATVSFSQSGNIITIDVSATLSALSTKYLCWFGMPLLYPNPSVSGIISPAAIDQPVALYSGVNGSIAAWHGLAHETHSISQQSSRLWFFWNGSKTPRDTSQFIAPGQTVNWRIKMAVGQPSATTVTQVSLQPYADYRQIFPILHSFPDRRPIWAWFLSNGNQRSDINPRGYWSSSTVNALNPTTMRNKMIEQTNLQIARADSMTVKPQGFLLWDIEGQQFEHATTYIGDPRALGYGYAPEMNAVADEMIGMLKAAGYKVGFTLRPQYMTYGPLADRPAACYHHPSNNEFSDHYIATDQARYETMYVCTATDTWQTYGTGNGLQQCYLNDQIDEMIALLKAKAQYAINRWGASIFYLDSFVLCDGGAPLPHRVAHELAAQFPHILFMPEQETFSYFRATAPFQDLSPSLCSSMPFPANNSRLTWPNSFAFGYWTNCRETVSASVCGVSNTSCLAYRRNDFRAAVKMGSIVGLGGYGISPLVQHQAYDAELVATLNEMSSVVVTDSSTNRKRSFSANPGFAFSYPLRLRVYFALSEGGIDGSALYCDGGVSAHLGLSYGQTECTLDLTGMTHYQLRLYDYAGGLVSAGLAATL